MSIEQEQSRLPLAKEGRVLTQREINGIGAVLVDLMQQVRGGGGMQFQCNFMVCSCSGDADCNDMFSTSVCGDGICFEDGQGGVVCFCFRN